MLQESELSQLESSLDVDEVKREIDLLQREAKQHDKKMSELTWVTLIQLVSADWFNPLT